jgi:methionine-rich copper-binding protein CopC
LVARKLVAACTVLGLTALGAPAAAHGELQATDPASGATVRRAPRSVAITFTEAPTAQAVLRVKDGCEREVGQGVDVVDATATVRVATGQPGRWRVSYRVISALDGHETQGAYSFTVAGQKDCTPDGATPAPDGTGPDPGETRAAPTDDGTGDTGSGAPVVPIALGAVAVVVLALILRRSGSA